jgi:subfamily B ATP-binding cassette protein MsbA
MKSVQQKIRTHLLETQQQPMVRLPSWLRNLVRAVSGGDSQTAKFIRAELWKYRWLIGIALVASIGSGLVETATIGVITLALNTLASLVSDIPVEISGRTNTIVLQVAQFLGIQEPIFLLLILAVGLQILRSSLDFASQAAYVAMRVWMESDLQRRIFSQLINIRYQQLIRNRLGNLTSYTQQVQESGGIVQSIGQTVNDGILIAAYVIALFWLSWEFTLVAVVILGLFSLGMNRIRSAIRRSISGYVRTTVRINERILEFLQGIRIVHIFVREKMVIDDVNRIITEGIPPRRTGLMRRVLIAPLFQSIGIVGFAIFLGLGYWSVTTTGTLQIGEFVAYMYVIYRILPRLSSLNAQLGIAAGQWPYVARIAELLDWRGKEREYLPGREIKTLREGIELRAVDLRYPEGERDALHQLSFRIPKGKMIALIGSSGSGKSSIINLLLGLYRPTGGQILVDGLDLNSYDLASWRTLIGVVDQDTQIFSSSIADNIRFGKPDATDEEVIAAAKIANAHEFIQEMPQGYQTEVGDRGYRLSGGQRQRIAIARAIVHAPEILFFDEATSALDSQSERLIQASLEELRKERTLVVIAHRLSTIIRADEIIVLDNGQIVESGTHQELLEKQGRYAAMWKLQTDAA